MTQIYVDKLVTFTYRDGKFDVAIFSGELAPGMRVYKLRIPARISVAGNYYRGMEMSRGI